MYPQALITAIVQQTTVLIAQISTAAGIRAPLVRVADQVPCRARSRRRASDARSSPTCSVWAIRAYQKKVQSLEHRWVHGSGRAARSAHGGVYAIAHRQIRREPPRLVVDQAVQRGLKTRDAKLVPAQEQ